MDAKVGVMGVVSFLPISCAQAWSTELIKLETMG